MNVGLESYGVEVVVVFNGEGLREENHVPLAVRLIEKIL